MTKKIKVAALENGPLRISDQETLSYCGNSVKTEGDVYLCRCGESNRAPFCDGAHAKVGFESANQTSETKETVLWEGEKIRTFFDPNACMHVMYCKPLKELRASEATDSTTATAEEIARVALSCPSGAIQYEMKTQMAEPTEQHDSQIEVIEGGEIRFHAPLEAIDFKLNGTQPDDRVTLCRCGISKNKPFCDGAHVRKPSFK